MLKTIVDSILVPALRALNDWARRHLFIGLVMATLLPLANLFWFALLHLGVPRDLWILLILVMYAAHRWLGPALRSIVRRAVARYIARTAAALELGVPPHPATRLFPVSAALLLALAAWSHAADLPPHIAVSAVFLAAGCCLLWRAPSAQAAWTSILPEVAELPPVFTSTIAPPTRPTVAPPPAR